MMMAPAGPCREGGNLLMSRGGLGGFLAEPCWVSAPFCGSPWMGCECWWEVSGGERAAVRAGHHHAWALPFEGELSCSVVGVPL